MLCEGTVYSTDSPLSTVHLAFVWRLGGFVSRYTKGRKPPKKTGFCRQASSIRQVSPRTPKIISHGIFHLTIFQNFWCIRLNSAVNYNNLSDDRHLNSVLFQWHFLLLTLQWNMNDWTEVEQHFWRQYNLKNWIKHVHVHYPLLVIGYNGDDWVVKKREEGFVANLEKLIYSLNFYAMKLRMQAWWPTALQLAKLFSTVSDVTLHQCSEAWKQPMEPVPSNYHSLYPSRKPPCAVRSSGLPSLSNSATRLSSV